MTSAIHKRPFLILPEILGDKSTLQCQPLLSERMRESARQKCAKRERGSPRLNSKRLPPKNFCWWWQNPSKQSAQNKRTGAAGAKATWGFHFIWYMFWGSGEGGRWVVIVLRDGRDGYDVAATLFLSVFLLGVLELWMCRGLHYCCGQWNMLKWTLSFIAVGRGQEHTCWPKWTWPEKIVCTQGSTI